jgi:hypothetical protein
MDQLCSQVTLSLYALLSKEFTILLSTLVVKQLPFFLTRSTGYHVTCLPTLYCTSASVSLNVPDPGLHSIPVLSAPVFRILVCILSLFCRLLCSGSWSAFYPCSVGSCVPDPGLHSISVLSAPVFRILVCILSLFCLLLCGDHHSEYGYECKAAQNL